MVIPSVNVASGTSNRVIGANGDLTGYASGLTIKERLLEIEYGSA